MIRPFSSLPALCVAATLLATGAQGQQLAPGSAQPQPRPAAGAGTAANVAPSHLALARELATITGVLGLLDPIVPQFTAQIKKGAVTRPELTKDLDQVLEAMKPDIEQQKQPMIETIVLYYARTFSEPELKELVTFFKNPLGQKYLQLAPRIIDDLAAESAQWGVRLSEFMMTRVRTELGKRGHQM